MEQIAPLTDEERKNGFSVRTAFDGKMFPTTKQGAIDYIKVQRMKLGDKIVDAIINCGKRATADGLSRRYKINPLTVLEIWDAASDAQ